MHQFFDFVVNHWILWLLLAIAIVFLIIEEVRGRVAGVSRVNPQDLTRLINREEAVVIDLRDANAFKTGHIVGALNIPHTAFASNIEKLTKYKSKPIVLVCSNGQTSPLEAAKLKKQGFEKVYFLHGGLRAWQESNLPFRGEA